MGRTAFGKMADAIRGEQSPATAQGYLRPIDTSAIAKRLDLDGVASERAVKELPSSDAKTLDSIEQQITHTIESEWTWHGSELLNNLRAYAQRLAEFSVQTELANIQLLSRNTLTQLRDANHRAEAELGPLRETYIAFRDELREFQTRNNLRRAARDPSNRLTTMGLLVLLISVEAGMNGVFFSKGSEFGLLGGIVTAVGISFANVLIAYSIGLFPMRWINHKNIFIKFVGLIFSLAGLTALIGLHGFAAHYRDVIGTVGEENALPAAINTLLRHPIELADVNSYYLFGLGAVLASTAIWKGYTNDDPYPRYGAYYRRAVHARKNYSDEHADLFDELDEIKERTVTAIKAGTQRIPLFPQQAVQVRAERNAALEAFAAYENSVEAAINQLLSRYRDANISKRKSPAPSYFDVAWRLPRSFLNEAAVHAAIAEPPTPQLDANAALYHLQRLSSAVLEEYEALLVKYPHPTGMQSQ